MKFVSAQENGRAPFLGVVGDEVVHPVDGFSNVTDALLAGASLLELGEAARGSTPINLELLTLLSPITPSAMRDCMCFHEHIRNCRPDGFDPRHHQYPAFYITNANAVIGPEEDVLIPPGCEKFDYELEVSAVLGTTVTNPTPDEAAAAIAGYTIYIDWSARDLQMDEMGLGLGPAKGKDSATTLGPYFVTADELEARRSGLGFDITMKASVNGLLVTDGNWNSINWSFGDVIAYAARGTSLRTGEVLGSGTVGFGCLLEHERTGSAAFPGWLKAGDVVTFDVDVLGSFSQTIVEGLPRHPLTSGH